MHRRIREVRGHLARCESWFLPCLLTLAIGLLQLLPSGIGFARSNAPYAEFRNLPLRDLAGVQLKLTPRCMPLWYNPSVVVAGPAVHANVFDFRPFRDPRFTYSCDGAVKPLTHTVTAEAMRAILDSTAFLESAIDTIADRRPALSFALLREDEGRRRVFEALISERVAVELLGRLRGALVGDPSACTTLREFACASRLLSPYAPQAELRPVSMTIGRTRLDSGTGELVTQVEVTNDSDHALVAPIYLLIRFLGKRVRLVNADGVTCQLPTYGTPYIVLPVRTSLGVHQSVEVSIRYVDPDRSGPEFTGTIYTGPGDP